MSIIEVNHVTKEYRLGHRTRLKDTLAGALARVRGLKGPKRKDFKALDDIDFKVEQGEVVGIIGPNGSGKSTLLKILSNVIKPTSGSIQVKGKVAPLIEVGAGLVGDLTGRENIFLNSSILGIPRSEIKKKLEDIISFAELEEFIDTPIKRYSSGMKIRLGFSIATSIDADILIVDEVLAVGDLAFQRKCFDRMEELINGRGNTVLLVSHNIRQVQRLCTRVLLLDQGKMFLDGDKSEVCEIFYERSNTKIAGQSHLDGTVGRIRESGEIILKKISLIDKNGNEVNELVMGEPVTLHCVLESKVQSENVEVVFGFHTTDFVYVASMSNLMCENRVDIKPGKIFVNCHLPNLPLMPGVYALRFGLLDKYRRDMFYGEMLKTFPVHSDIDVAKMPILGLVDIPSTWSVE